jgi:hypothetical protein
MELGEFIAKHFIVDFDNGVILWKTPPKHHKELLMKNAGTCQRNKNGKEYWLIRIMGKGYRRGHLIFFAYHGRFAFPCIDHINGNSLDDRLENVREASILENAWNHKSRKKKSKLPMGVRIAQSGRFVSRIGYKSKLITIGTFNTVDEAHASYIQKRKELYGEFSGY